VAAGMKGGGAAAAPGVATRAEVGTVRRPAGRGCGTSNLQAWVAGSSGPTATSNGPTAGAAAVTAETPAATSHGAPTWARAAASRDVDNRLAWMASRDRSSAGGAAGGGAAKGGAAAMTTAAAAVVAAVVATGATARGAVAAGTGAEPAGAVAPAMAERVAVAGATAAEDEADAADGPPRPPHWAGMSKKQKRSWKQRLAGKRR
jgi:hypothetical protein